MDGPGPTVDPATAPVPGRRWLIAAVLGVAASILGAFAASFVGIRLPTVTIVGLVVGTIAAGIVVGARTVKRWAAAFGLVLLSQLALGLIVIIRLAGQVDESSDVLARTLSAPGGQGRPTGGEAPFRWIVISGRQPIVNMAGQYNLYAGAVSSSRR